MQLVDIDALLAYHQRRFDYGCGEYRDVVDVYTIYNAPIVEAEPVRHGRWVSVYEGEWLKCSECESHWASGLVDNCNMYYCPTCGARMDAKDGETDA